MGPTYAMEAGPLRSLLKPGAAFPPNEAQLQAIQRLKELIVEFHVLAIPDEAAAIAMPGPGAPTPRESDHPLLRNGYGDRL